MAAMPVTLSPWARRLVWSVVPTLVGLLLVLIERSRQVGAGLSSFVFAGLEHMARYPSLPDELRPSVSLQGYDGLEFYVLSLDPFSTELIAFTAEPGYRQQRILYPAGAWALARLLDQSTLVTLVVVNLVAAAVLAWLVAGLAMRWGRHPAFGTLAGLSPPVVVGTMYNTAEPLALALMVAGIVAILDRRPVLVALFLTGAAFTRETSAAVAVGLAAWLASDWLRTRRLDVPMLLAALTPLLMLALWQVILWGQWGDIPVASGGGSRVEGVVPVLDTVVSVFSPITVDDPGAAGSTQGLWWAGRVFVALAVVGALIAIVKSMIATKSAWPDVLATIYVAAAAPTLMTGAWLWTRQYTRSAGEWMLVSLLIMLKHPGPSSNVGMAGLALTSVVAVVL